MPPPPPTPPPTGSTTTRLIKVITRRASFRSSFSQLDGQDSSVDESDCPTTPKEDQWEQNVTMVEEHSRIDAAANIANPEGAPVPGKGCCSGKVAEEEDNCHPRLTGVAPPLRNLNHHPTTQLRSKRLWGSKRPQRSTPPIATPDH